MPKLTNRTVIEIAFRAAAKHLAGIDEIPSDFIEIYEGDPDATDGNCKARWKKLTEQELQLAIRMLDFAGYDIVKRET